MRYGLMLLGVGLVLAGCQRAPVSLPPFGVSNDVQYLPGQPGPGLVVDPNSPIPDVPKPIGFKALPKLCSSSVDAGGARLVHHVYQGVGAAGEAVALYRQALKQHGWHPVSIRGGSPDRDGGSRVVMEYGKGMESLRVGIGTGGNVTTVVVEIGPRGGLPAGGEG